jgi:hypothetical protein
MVRHRLRHKQPLQLYPCFSQVFRAKSLLSVIDRKMGRAARGLTPIRGCRGLAPLFRTSLHVL